MKSFVVVNRHRQWKISYGENEYWKLGARWFVDNGHTLTLVPAGELRNELEERLLRVKYDRNIYCYGN